MADPNKPPADPTQPPANAPRSQARPGSSEEDPAASTVMFQKYVDERGATPSGSRTRMITMVAGAAVLVVLLVVAVLALS
ncbi:hypothetical protein ABZV93_18870 [Actinopolymorpha sp. NPDC004070]|uniref:hypothetical protein n=1 Tax=Actinopolymorpha sp. NPDC004070 TaxID=3154548 RepID=UPI0033B0A6CE